MYFLIAANLQIVKSQKKSVLVISQVDFPTGIKPISTGESVLNNSNLQD